jgi:tetratricopeptide (TPR) repeat protein
MSVGSRDTTWFSDPEQLLATLRQSKRPGVRSPVIPGYRDFREIKRGGQGVVYQATQLSTKRTVAVKVLAGGAFAGQRTRRRFEREVDLAASLDHPNIVRIYDSGETPDGQPYFVMEYIEGVPLDAVTPAADESSGRTIPFRSVRDTFELFAKIAESVHYANQRGVIHRDLKPSNIRLDGAGEPHVLDFGLAKLTDGEREEGVSQMSVTGDFLGSLPWASPEQAEGRPDRIDVRTDVYSLGVCLFQCLTGRFPYPVTGSFRQVLDAIQEQAPARPRQYRADLDDEAETIVLKCLEKEPERRYQSAGELARDLRHYLAGESLEAKRDSGWYQVRKTLRRYRWLVRGGIALTVASIAAAIGFSILYQRAKAAERAAQVSEQAAIAAREIAVEARRNAEREAANAREINALLTNMLSRPINLGREARVVDIIDETARAMDERATTDRAVEAGLRDTLGTVYARLSMIEQAEAQFAKAEALRAGPPPVDAVGAVYHRSQVAWLRGLQGRYAEAEGLYRQALATWMAEDPPRPAAIASVQNDLALILEQQGRLSEARDLLRAAVAAAEAGHIPLVDRLACMGNLAGVLHGLGELAEAETLMRQRLEMSIETFGVDQAETATAANNYSVLLLELEKLDLARALAEQALTTRRKLFGDEHPETNTAFMNLAGVQMAMRESAAAAENYRRALAGMQNALGPDHPNCVNAMSNLAWALEDIGEYEEAERLFREALAKREEQNGPDSVNALRTANNLATLLMRGDRMGEAAPLLERVLTGMRKHMPPDHPDLATMELNQATVYRELKRFDESRALAQHALELRRKHFEPNSFRVLHAELDLAECDFVERKYEAAVAATRGIRARAEAEMGEESYFAVITRARLARYLSHAGHEAEAAELFERSLRETIAQVGPGHTRTRDVCRSYRDFCVKYDRPVPPGVEAAATATRPAAAGAQ